MSENEGKHAAPSHTEPTDTAKSRARLLQRFVHDTNSEEQQTAQSTIPKKDRQDREIDDDNGSSPSSSSSSYSDWTDTEDDIDPQESASVAGIQSPSHRTKPSALHLKNVSQQQQQPRPQPVLLGGSTAVESGASVKFSYPDNTTLGPGPRGGAGRVPAPAASQGYYGRSGYPGPDQAQFTTPYWQRSPDKEGKEMIPYPMWNLFAPGQGAWPPPAAPVERKSHRAQKRPLKVNERPQSTHALGAESRLDVSAADRAQPIQGPGKSGGGVDVPPLAADVDAVYRFVDAKDITVHLELDLFRDSDEELEEFNRLVRMGNFAAADSFFESYLREHMNSDPSIFVQYAEMLLKKGDYRSLLLLDGTSVFGRRDFNSRKDPEMSDAKEPLEMNWMLVRACALMQSQHELHKVWSGIKTPLPGLPTTSDIGSTELRVFGTGIRMTRLAPARIIPRELKERGLSDWADWKSIYRQLLEKQRIWDFRDVLIDACVSYDTGQALNAFLDHDSPIEGMVADWQTGTPDESTQLALLDLLSFIALRSDQFPEDVGLVGDCLRLAEPIGNSLLDKFPRAVHSRPFIQWLVSKAVMKYGSERFAYLEDYAGLAICPKTAGGLPFYIPIRRENPGWVPEELAPAARNVLQAALEASRDMKDYQTETLCLKSLAIGTRDSVAYFEQLGQLQKTQGDMAGFLSTCLTRYLICEGDESKQVLLEDLNSLGSWKDESDLVNPIGAAGRDVLQHALSRDPAKIHTLSIMSASRFSLHLPEHFKSLFRYLPRPRLTETEKEPRPTTETSRVEQHSEGEDEPQESPENNNKSRNTHHNGRHRVGNKSETKDKHQSAAPGFYPGPWPNYTVPPYYPMNMMYGAQPPPPPDLAPRPPSRPPVTEEDTPSPQLLEMKKQLELLQAERKGMETSKRWAEREQKIKEDCERAFKIRMSEMEKAQEEARKEVELAKIAAERAARERIEEERKAEAERQRQHAEMMAKAERDARDRLEKEREVEDERQRQYAEAVARAERRAKEKYRAALEEEEEHRWREEAMREKMREEIREEMRNEMRAVAREEREREDEELERRGREQRWVKFARGGQKRTESEWIGEERERGRRRSAS